MGGRERALCCSTNSPGETIRGLRNLWEKHHKRVKSSSTADGCLAWRTRLCFGVSGGRFVAVCWSEHGVIVCLSISALRVESGASKSMHERE